MTGEKVKRKLTAILSADVKGYSRLMREDEVSTLETLKAYLEVTSTLIQKHNGRVVDSPGDNVLAEFVSVVDAVECAAEIQKNLKIKNADLPENRRMEFRIGVNLGDVIEDEERIYGDGVNIAARVEGLAEGGGICISGTVYEHVKDKVGLEYESLGEHTVKNITDPVPIYRITPEPRTSIPRPDIQIELPNKPSIAVLPFANMSGDPQQDYIADGITENIITALSKISGVFVIARNSVFTYKGRAAKVQQVSEDLGVRYVLEGSLLKSGDRVRITAQLVDATTGHHLWADRYDRQMMDFFDLLDEITRKIVLSLQVELTQGERARMLHEATDSFEAWGYAVRGVSLWERETKENNARARELFERAVKIDPGYSTAWTYLAWTYFMDARFEWSASPAGSPEKARALDDTQAEVHSLLSSIHVIQRHHEKAISEAERAIALEPNNSNSHAILADALDYAGRFEEGIVVMKKAMLLSPYCPAWYLECLATSYYMVGRYEESIETSKQLLDRCHEGGPLTIYGHLNLAVAYVMLGREEEARTHTEEALKIDPHYSLEVSRKLLVYKRPEDSERILDLQRKAGIPEKSLRSY